MTQKESILKFVAENGSITPLDAMREFGIMRLSARIHDLENEGYVFSHEMESAKNRYGKLISYCRYKRTEVNSNGSL